MRCSVDVVSETNEIAIAMASGGYDLSPLVVKACPRRQYRVGQFLAQSSWGYLRGLRLSAAKVSELDQHPFLDSQKILQA